MQPDPGATARWLAGPAAFATAAAGVAAFHAACQWDAAAGLIVVYLAALFRLAWVPSARWAFYLGLAIGFAVGAPQLHFFLRLFGPAAVGLWLAFGLWHAVYLLVARRAVGRWPMFGALWLPVVWFGLEYFRSELYYLRFSWLTPGFAMSHPAWVPLADVGMHGISLVVMAGLAVWHVARSRPKRLPSAREASAEGTTEETAAPSADAQAGARLRLRRYALPAYGTVFLVLPVAAALLPVRPAATGPAGPFVVGIQLEGASDAAILAAMESAVGAYPDLDLLVLPEYAFEGPVPDAARDWCRRHRRHLVAGGKEFLDGTGSEFENTVWVIGPEGDELFRQVKCVPVQFMSDGRPARSQDVWRSPWGKIGLAICYDLSYARVLDRLVRAGAEALIVPTMDNIEWGRHERVLHAKVAPVRAREYRLPIFRVASSGISQLVMPDGRVVASAPFPGQNERISGLFPMGARGRLPPDRWLALPAVCGLAGLLLWMSLTRPEREDAVRNGHGAR